MTGQTPRLRKRIRGAKTWYYYDAGGKPRVEIPLGSDYAVALKKWAEYEGTTARLPASITFAWAAGDYFKRVVPTKAPRTQQDNAKELKQLLKFFNDPPAPLDQITPYRVKQYMRWRVESGQGKGAVRAVREKALLSHIWNFSREEGYTSLPNPCTGIRGAKGTSRGRDIYVEDVVKDAIREAADLPTREMIDLAYLCGQRPNDTVKLSETQIRDGIIHVRGAKTKEKVRIEIEGELAALIDRIIARKRTYPVYTLSLVVNEKGEPMTLRALQERFRKVRLKAAADVKNVTIRSDILASQLRDFRAKAATDDTERKDIRAAQEKLGHTNIRMTEHYVRRRRGAKVKPTR